MPTASVRRLPRRFSIAALLLALCACAPLEWHKTGAAGAYNVEQDEAECLSEARAEARQRMPLQPTSVPQIVIDQQGRSIPVNTPPQPDADRFFLEQGLLRQCMTARGYLLQSRPSPE